MASWRLTLRQSIVFALLLFFCGLPTGTPSAGPVVTALRSLSETMTPNGTASESSSLSLNSVSMTRSNTESDSHPLPVYPAVISLMTSNVIPSHCISTSVATSEARSCRTIVFSMINDGFPRDSAALTFSATRTWMAYTGGGELNPFGLLAQWQSFAHDLEVHSNVTHLILRPNRNPGLVLVDTEYFTINLTTSIATLRHEVPVNTSVFRFAVTPTDVRTPRPFLEVTMVAASMSSIAATLLPMNSPLADVQALVMSGLSYCMQPTIHDVSLTGLRTLFPAAETTASLFDKMMSNIILLVSFTGFHLFSVAAVMLKTGNGFEKSAASAMFPSVSMSLALFLHPGNIIAGVKMLTSVTSPRNERGLGLVGIAVGLVFLAIPYAATRFGFRATSRPHNTTLWGFPYLLRLSMPDSSWGPNSETHSWLVPSCAMRPQRLSMVSLGTVYLTVMAVITAFEPTDRYTCAVFFAALMALNVAHAVVVLRFQPYRSRFVCVATAISNLLFLAPISVSMARCFDIAADTLKSETAVASLLGLCYIVAFFRSIGTIVAAVMEQKLVRHKVWPDRKMDLPTRAEEEELQKQKLASRVEPILPEDIAKVESYRPPQPETLLADPEVESDDERKEFNTKFGEVAPLPKRVLPKPSKRAQRSNAALRNPMHTLLRDEGYLPPEVRAQREKEYSLI